MLGVRKFIKKNFSVLSVGAVLILLAIFLLFILPRYRNAQAAGEKVGTAVGGSVGTAIGSFKGISSGVVEGRNDGLSAKDTTVIVEDIKTAASEMGKLEILAAQVKLTNLHTVGDTYTALYFLRSDAIFTVDLGQAAITAADDKISILLPSPEMDLYINNRETEKVAEYQRTFFNGSTADGFTDYLNSLNQIIEKAEDSIANYDALMEQARSAALRQVKLLVGEICGSERELQVSFQ